MKIIEISGPDSSIKYPIKEDGGRERVIEWLSKELGKEQIVSVVAQCGSHISHCNIIEVFHRNGLEPEEFYSAFCKDNNRMRCDILHVHHPKYLIFSQSVDAKQVVLTHHGFFEGMSCYRDRFSFTETYVSRYLQSVMDFNSKGSVIYNPIPEEEYPLLTSEKKIDLLFVGDCNKKVKRLDIAISVASALKVKLFVAGKASTTLTDILKNNPNVEYLGEINQETKLKLMSLSRAVICPNDAPEAFCLVAAEANAVGSPVLCSNNGGLPEVIDDGISGYICKNLDEYIYNFKKIDELEPVLIRNNVLSKFDSKAIAGKYMELFNLKCNGSNCMSI